MCNLAIAYAGVVEIFTDGNPFRTRDAVLWCICRC